MAAKFHTSIRTLPVYNFYEVLNSGDLTWLYIDKKGKEDLSEVWNIIYNQYCEAAKIDNRHLVQIAKVAELTKKYNKVALLLELLLDEFTEVRFAACDALKKYNYILRKDKPLDEEYKRLKSQLGSLATKIKIEEDKLPKNDKKEAVNLIKQAASLMRSNPGLRIDIYTDSVERWIAEWELEKEKIQAQQRIQNKARKR